jgi:small subunit ribosomal protein S20
LANTQSAIKRLRSSERKRQHNRIFRGQARTTVKKARSLIERGRLEEAREAVQAAVRALDKAAAKGIIHKNNAARRKSRLMQQLNQADFGELSRAEKAA